MEKYYLKLKTGNHDSINQIYLQQLFQYQEYAKYKTEIVKTELRQRDSTKKIK